VRFSGAGHSDKGELQHESSVVFSSVASQARFDTSSWRFSKNPPSVREKCGLYLTWRPPKEDSVPRCALQVQELAGVV
jgi:hypothetical protein